MLWGTGATGHIRMPWGKCRCHGTQVPQTCAGSWGGAAGEVTPQDPWRSVLQDNK